MKAAIDYRDMEKRLDSFNMEERFSALEQLLREDQGRTSATIPPGAGNELFNMHLHSFFSYNANGYSPCRIAWEAHKAGLYAAALCDFDVLDGLDEFFKAGLLIGLRTSVHIETRAFFNEYAKIDINSPGEPGVNYVMGSGFAKAPSVGTSAANTLAGLRRQANERNIALAGRINSKLPEIAVDYQSEVVLTSPGGCPTERHIIRAYRLKAEQVFGPGRRLFEFWAGLMKKEPDELGKMYSSIPSIEDKIRSLLAKAGGLGYERPDARAFPPLDDFIRWVLDCGALPTITWLDGTTRGEENPGEMFEIMMSKGACALNIIPDRNHNIADPAQREKKLAKLDEVVRLAQKLELPVNIGTEMNKDGQPFADDTRLGALRPYQRVFLRGARIMVGHSILARFCNFSYVGAAARAEFGAGLKAKNNFFETVGSIPPLTSSVANRLEDLGPEKALAAVRQSAGHGAWKTDS